MVGLKKHLEILGQARSKFPTLDLPNRKQGHYPFRQAFLIKFTCYNGRVLMVCQPFRGLCTFFVNAGREMRQKLILDPDTSRECGVPSFVPVTDLDIWLGTAVLDFFNNKRVAEMF
jgi:hypothetical protein